jgi:hypothetical protein
MTVVRSRHKNYFLFNSVTPLFTACMFLLATSEGRLLATSQRRTVLSVEPIEKFKLYEVISAADDQ